MMIRTASLACSWVAPAMHCRQGALQVDVNLVAGNERGGR